MVKLKNHEKVLVALAGGVLVIFLASQFDFSGKKAPHPLVATKTAAPGRVTMHEREEGAPQSKALQTVQKRPGATWVTWGRDPFAQAHRLGEAASTAPGTNPLELRGIIWNGNDASALIGDRILKKGERMGTLTVLDILPDRVVCKMGNKVMTLTLQKREK